MIFVQAGSFQRDGDPENISVVSRGFWMAETEVTKELYIKVMAGWVPTDPYLPVGDINWYEAIAFCNKLSLREGRGLVYSVKGVDDWGSLDVPVGVNPGWGEVIQDMTQNGYRLPTEMEWMWAAMGAQRGPDKNPEDILEGSLAYEPNTTGYLKPYAGAAAEGDAGYGDYAWYEGNSSGLVAPVGELRCNELGFYDMSGNVWEWCWDYHDNSWPSGTLVDYARASGSRRLHKGGSFSNSGDLADDETARLKITARSAQNPPTAGDIGFRIVRGL
jgi:formylglycine-generating enzyme required for sulfatase activity